MRLYTVQFNNVAISASQDLFGLLATSGKAFKVHWIELGQKSLAAWEAREVQLVRNPVTVTAGSGGSSATPVRVNPGANAAVVTARVNDTTPQSTSGSADVIFSREWELLNGFFWMPAPEQRPVIAPSQGLALRLGTSPSGAMTASGTLMFEELF